MIFPLDWYSRRTYFDIVNNRVIIWTDEKINAAKIIQKAYRQYKDSIKHRPIR